MATKSKTLFIKGGCFGFLGCSHHSDEYMEEKHEAILKILASQKFQSVSSQTRRKTNGDIQFEYSLEDSNEISREHISNQLRPVISCLTKETVLIKRNGKQYGPNYPHLILSETPISIETLYQDSLFLNYPPERRHSIV